MERVGETACHRHPCLDLYILGNWTELECTESCGTVGVLKKTRTCKPKDATVICTKAETEKILGTPCNRTLCATLPVSVGAAFVAGSIIVILVVVMFKRRRKRSHSD